MPIHHEAIIFGSQQTSHHISHPPQSSSTDSVPTTSHSPYLTPFTAMSACPRKKHKPCTHNPLKPPADAIKEALDRLDAQLPAFKIAHRNLANPCEDCVPDALLRSYVSFADGIQNKMREFVSVAAAFNEEIMEELKKRKAEMNGV
jgi:hypothetical protein